MNDRTPLPDKDDPAELKAGGRLAAARRAHNISVREISKELHIDEPKVLALEENRFEDLGAPVFAKGHMRKYAELVGVPVDDILADYYHLNKATGAPPVVGPKRRVQRDLSLGPWLLALFVLAIAGGAYWWWSNFATGVGEGPDTEAGLAPFASEEAPSATEDTEGPDATGVQDQPTDARTTIAEAAPAEVRTLPGDTDAPAEDAAAVEQPPPSTAVRVAVPPDPIPTPVNAIRLRLTFSGDCWTEVTDANGRRLFFDLGAAGRTVTLSGERPLRVLLGNSENVVLEVEGEPYSMAAAEMRGNTARLTINGQ